MAAPILRQMLGILMHLKNRNRKAVLDFSKPKNRFAVSFYDVDQLELIPLKCQPASFDIS